MRIDNKKNCLNNKKIDLKDQFTINYLLILFCFKYVIYKPTTSRKYTKPFNKNTKHVSYASMIQIYN